MVNVTKENFIEQSNDFLYHLPKASFIAIDEEMTGISMNHKRTNNNNHSSTKDCTPAQRYQSETLKLVPETYSIIQLGVALYFVHEDEDNDGVGETTGATTATTTTAGIEHRHSVTQLPSSPIRTSSSSSTGAASSGNRRGYAVSTTPTIMNRNNDDADAGRDRSSLPIGTKYAVRRYNFYIFPNDSSSSATPWKRYDNNNDNNSNNNNNNNNNNNKSKLPPPPPEQHRDIVLNPSTVSFLLGHNMSFDTWMKYGINYATSPELANYYLQSYQQYEIYQIQNNPFTEDKDGKLTCTANTTNTTSTTTRTPVKLSRPEDIQFHARAMATLREWLDNPITVADGNANTDTTNPNTASVVTNTGSPAAGGSSSSNSSNDPMMIEHSLLLPPCNSFLRRSLYESIGKEYPSLIVENGGQSQIRVWRLNIVEQQQRYIYQQQQRYMEFIRNTIGMYRIFEAIRLVCNGYTIDYTNPLFATSYSDIDWDTIISSYENSANSTNSNTDEMDHNDKWLTSQIQPQNRTRQPIPLVVHNGFMDMCFLMAHFVTSTLPTEYHECRELIHSYFPYIYDTKVLATECLCWDTNDTTNNSNTNLSNLFHMVVRNPMYYYLHATEEQDLERNSRTLLDDIYVVPFTSVDNSNMGTDINVEDQEHEAAYDAYMTGCIFIGLCQRISQRMQQQRPLLQANHTFPLPIALSCSKTHFVSHPNVHHELRSFYGLNKIYQMSIYTTDLEETRYNRDPMSKGMLSDSTYRVSNIDKAVSTRDIVQALSNLIDAKNRTVNFVIVWIDDTTFLVAASYRPTSVNVVVQPVVVSPTPLIPAVLEEGEEVDENDDGVVDTGTTTTVAKDDTETILREHGMIILRALQERFRNNEIITVQEEYLAQVAKSSNTNVFGSSTLEHDDCDKNKSSWLTRVWSLFGWTSAKPEKKRSFDEIMEPSSKKRQRVH